jgi:AcrR family transcriptional regulator
MFMGENQQRRRAQRQKRGLLRVEEIQHAAGALFAEVGYDNATTNMIAARAGISPGSLYQFFPDKEAIAQAFAADVTEQLHLVYDTFLSPEMLALPLQPFLESFIDEIVAFNRKYPGYLALELASTVSASLVLVLADLHQGLLARMDALFVARWPQSTREQRRLPILVSYRLFLALLPLALESNGEQQQATVREMKAVLYRYWKPIIETQGASETLSRETYTSEEE